MKSAWGSLLVLAVACARHEAPAADARPVAVERRELTAGSAAFRALPAHNGTLTLQWMNGEPQLIKDRGPSSAGELFGFGWSNRLYLYKSADNGQSWSFADPLASETVGTPRLMGATQDSLGKVHLLYADGAAGSIKYARVALDRSATGAITAFHSEVKNVALPGSYNTNNDTRGYVRPVVDLSGTEVLMFAVNDNPLSPTRFRLQMGKTASLTPAATADFTRLDGTAGVTVAFNTNSFNNHDHSALFAQLGATKDVWVFWGPIDAEYGAPDSTFMTRLQIAASGQHTWSVGTPITTVGSDSLTSPELLSVVGTQNYVWLTYLNPTKGLSIDRVAATGAYSTDVVPSPEGLPHRNGWASLAVADDETRLWLIWNLLTSSNAQFITRRAFWSGQSWSQLADSAPFIGDAWGMAGTWGWSEGVAAVRLDGSTNALQLSTIYGGDAVGLSAPPSITKQPISVAVVAPSTATFSVTATGAPAPTYQWLRNGAPIAGATAASYTTPATTGVESGDRFSVVVSSLLGAVTSSEATLTVSVRPSVVTQPQGVSVVEGQPAGFSVVAAGSPTLAYQWRKNDVAIAGATSPSYTIAAAALTDDGASFDVVVTNAVGSAVSSKTVLSVRAFTAAPVITVQPVDALVDEGAAASFTVVANGTPAPAFQWLRDGTPIPQATQATFSTSPTQASDTGAAFSVIVSNVAGTVTSVQATLSVRPAPLAAPAIVTQPSALKVTEGETATFTVGATGAPAPSYQWRKNGVDVPGATSASYTTPATTMSDDGALYSVQVFSALGSVVSVDAALTVSAIVYPPPGIVAQPQGATVNEGQGVSFVVTATAAPTPPTYQWYRNGAALAGATTDTYVLPTTVAADDGATFFVIVSGRGGSVTSAAATLFVIPNVLPSFLTQPQPVAVTEGTPATFAVSVAGRPSPLLQWRKNGVDIAGATAASYTTPPSTSADNDALFSVAARNALGVVLSGDARLTVNAIVYPPPVITAQPLSVTVSEGQGATFSVQANATPSASYQWWRDGSPIAGATGTSFTLAQTLASDTGAVFSVVVSSQGGSVTSMGATLTVLANSLPTFTLQPVSVTVAAGASATFSVSVTGRPTPTLQWRKGGVAIAGATGASYTTPPATGADSGAAFTVVATNAAGAVTSAQATLTVNVPATFASCNALHVANASAPSGTYTIDPDAAGPNAPFSVYCDMTTNGGGWSVIYESGTARKASTALDYTVRDTALRNGASEVLLAFRDASLNLLAGSHTARFALPPEWKTRAPFQYANNDATVNAYVDAATAPVSRVLHYGYRDFVSDRCTDAWYLGGNEGRICLENTQAPFYMGFSTSISDGCPDSTQGALTRLCSASVRYSIAVR